MPLVFFEDNVAVGVQHDAFERCGADVQSDPDHMLCCHLFKPPLGVQKRLYHTTAHFSSCFLQQFLFGFPVFCREYCQRNAPFPPRHREERSDVAISASAPSSRSNGTASVPHVVGAGLRAGPFPQQFPLPPS